MRPPLLSLTRAPQSDRDSVISVAAAAAAPQPSRSLLVVSATNQRSVSAPTSLRTRPRRHPHQLCILIGRIRISWSLISGVLRDRGAAVCEHRQRTYIEQRNSAIDRLEKYEFIPRPGLDRRFSAVNGAISVKWKQKKTFGSRACVVDCMFASHDL